MRTSTRFLRLNISVFFAFAIAFVSFVYWAPWTTTLTVVEASKRYPGQVDPSWPAVRVEHGRVSEWRLGTPRQNPWAFSLCTASMFSALIYGFATVVWLEKHQRGEKPAANE